MTANITVITQEEKGLTVPMEALYFTPTEDVAKAWHIKLTKSKEKKEAKVGSAKKETGVWIQAADGSVKYQPVKVGINDGINAIVQSGLKQGEKVILSASAGPKASKKNEAASNPLTPKRPASANSTRPSSN